MGVRSTGAAIAAAVMLAACGEADAPGTRPPAGAAAPAGWNALDACATLSKDTVSVAAGQPVTGTELAPGSPGGEVLAAFSTCTYALPKGQLMVLTRQSPIADATPEAIERARTADGTLPPATDVPGLGRAALWSRESKGLQVFLDDRRYVSINFFGLPEGEDVRARAIAVARALK